MKTIIFLFSLLSVVSLQIQAQETSQPSGTVTGSISTPSGIASSATVRLLLVKDSTIRRTVLSDTAGHFSIDHLAPGNYLLRIEALGFKKYYSTSFQLTPTIRRYTFPKLQLTPAARQLDEAVVTGHRPEVEQHLDRTVINVDASPSNTGLSALDILEKSPGVSVDQDGNVSLNGRSAPLILVDGKPTYLSPADLATLLKAMPGSQLDQIEIMTNPPAKYDAAGNSGAINIRTKKLRSQGFNANLLLGGGTGIHARSNNSLSVNYHTGKVNLFASYGYTYIDQKDEFVLDRNLHDPQGNAITQVFEQNTILHSIRQTHTIKSGIDLDLSKKTSIGLTFNGLFNPTRIQNPDVTDILDGHHVLDSITTTNGIQHQQFNKIGGSLDFHHSFDAKGKDLDIGLDYTHYHSGNDQLFDNYFYDAQNNPTDPEQVLQGHLPENIDIYSAKLDYAHPLDSKTKLGLGAKSSYTRSDNDALYTDGIGSTSTVDKSLTNDFLYKENINAGYINLSRTFDTRWTAQAGLRLENTHAEGDQFVSSQSFRHNYTQLFPTAFVQYTLNADNRFGLSFGRRIQRPNYQDMNPFYYFLDKYTYRVGNPNLQPQLSNAIELKHIFREFLTSTISYSRTTNIISNIIEQSDSNAIAYATTGNIAINTYYSASLSFNRALTHWWKINVFAQEYYNRFHGVINNGPLNNETYTFSTTISNQFDMRKGWGLELSGLYRSALAVGTTVSQARESLDFGASKQAFNKKGTFRLSIRDFANILVYRFTTFYQNVDENGHYKQDSRVINLSFTYRFSKGKTSKQRQHQSSSEEEQSRVKSSN